MAEPRAFRVLTKRPDGSGSEFVDATPEQYAAYCAGDPLWCTAQPDTVPSVIERVWHRIAGRKTP